MYPLFPAGALVIAVVAFVAMSVYNFTLLLNVLAIMGGRISIGAVDHQGGGVK